MQPRVSIVAAIGRKRELGNGNALLWHIPEDLKRFKRLTLGHPVILGRKTFDSIVGMLGKPLPGRTNIVVTRDPSWSHEGAMRAGSLEEALAIARGLDEEEIFIGGGAQMWEQSFPHVGRLYLTLIDDEKPADTFFPAYEDEFKKVLHEEQGEHDGVRYRWIDLER